MSKTINIKHYQSASESQIQKALRHIWSNVRNQSSYHHTDTIKEAIIEYSLLWHERLCLYSCLFTYLHRSSPRTTGRSELPASPSVQRRNKCHQLCSTTGETAACQAFETKQQETQLQVEQPKSIVFNIKKKNNLCWVSQDFIAKPA